jgi:MSHA biogenesis protein MshO
MPRAVKYSRGFTLIEMIVTIVVIGILGVGVAGFIGRTTEGMMDASERTKVSAIAWIVSEKLSRELRSALPNSIRTNVSGSCVEYIPVVSASDYLSVPTLATASNFEGVPFPNLSVSDNYALVSYRVAVYPSTLSNLYENVVSASTNATISSLITDMVDESTDPSVTANAVRIDLNAAHQFLLDSPTRRFFVVDQPVMFCFESGALNRYSAYGYRNTIPTGLSDRSVMATGINLGSFDYNDATLTRNAVINIAYSIQGSNGELQPVNQEVQIRNVP